MNTYYHFTCLLHLPLIVSEGLKGGEIPIAVTMAYDQIPKAINLTTNGDPLTNESIWCGGSSINKTKIRLTIEPPEDEIVTFRQLREQYEVPERIIKRLCPYDERPKWFYVFRELPPIHITKYELLEDGQYQSLDGDKLKVLCDSIMEERERALIIGKKEHGRMKGASTLQMKDGVGGTWLLDNFFQENGLPKSL